jgi:hypothetical protein
LNSWISLHRFGFTPFLRGKEQRSPLLLSSRHDHSPRYGICCDSCILVFRAQRARSALASSWLLAVNRNLTSQWIWAPQSVAEVRPSNWPARRRNPLKNIKFFLTRNSRIPSNLRCRKSTRVLRAQRGDQKNILRYHLHPRDFSASLQTPPVQESQIRLCMMLSYYKIPIPLWIMVNLD